MGTPSLIMNVRKWGVSRHLAAPDKYPPLLSESYLFATCASAAARCQP